MLLFVSKWASRKKIRFGWGPHRHCPQEYLLTSISSGSDQTHVLTLYTPSYKYIHARIHKRFYKRCEYDQREKKVKKNKKREKIDHKIHTDAVSAAGFISWTCPEHKKWTWAARGQWDAQQQQGHTGHGRRRHMRSDPASLSGWLDSLSGVFLSSFFFGGSDFYFFIFILRWEEWGEGKNLSFLLFFLFFLFILLFFLWFRSVL